MFPRILCYLSVTIENICKQIIPAAKFAIRLAIASLHKLLDMNTRARYTYTLIYSSSNLLTYVVLDHG